MAHSPLPWRMEMIGGEWRVLAADGGTVCSDVEYYPAAATEDDMRLIVAAVNSQMERKHGYEGEGSGG